MKMTEIKAKVDLRHERDCLYLFQGSMSWEIYLPCIFMDGQLKAGHEFRGPVQNAGNSNKLVLQLL